MSAKKLTPIVIISTILLFLITAVFFKKNFRKKSNKVAETDWHFSDGIRNSDIKIFTAPKPARKIFFWNGENFVATAGGIFKIDDENHHLNRFLAVADGLPSNDIRDAIVIGNNLFLATKNGLAVVEPSLRTTILRSDRHPASNRMNDMSNNGGKILVCTDGGAFLLDDFDVKTVISSIRIVASTAVPGGFIFVDKDGQFYFADGDTVRKLSFEKLAKTYSIKSAGKNVICASGSGIFTVDIASGHFSQLDKSRVLATSICGNADSFWACGFWGADLIENGKKTRTIKVPPDWGAVRDVQQIDGKIFICGDGGVIDEDGNIYLTNAPPENKITSICKYRDALWVGTFSSGVATFDGGRWQTYRMNLPSNFVNAMTTDGKNLWIGTDNGLVMFNGIAKIFKKRNGLNSNDITSLFFDGKNIWAGTNRGVCVFKDFGWRQYYVSDGICGDHIYGISGRWNDIWIATYGGASEISRGSVECFRKVDGALKNDWATAVAMSGDGIFIGTYGGGISKFDGERWSFYAEGEIINPGAAAVVKGKPIFGTAGDGILIWDGMQFLKISTEEGLPCDEILSIFCDDEYIWIGTTDGLAAVPFKFMSP